MPLIDRAGLYQGEIRDHGITQTRKAKLPQFIVTFLADKVYNDSTDEWDGWEYEQTITGYFVLVTLNERGEVVKCLNYDQVMEATGWDGETYSGLAAMELKGKRIQLRVTEDTYDGDTRLKANWIAAEDADIGLRKLSGKDLTDLDAKFGAVPTTAKKPTAAKPGKKSSKAPMPPEAPKPPKANAPKPPEVPAGESCTQDDAYQACIEANEKLEAKAVPAEVLDDYWTANTTKIAADVKAITGEEWAKIRDATLGDIDIPF